MAGARSPIQNAADSGAIGVNGVIPDVESLRIPVKYLANLLTAGKEEPIVAALKKLLAMRAFMRSKIVDKKADGSILQAANLTVEQVESMYRYLAIANYEDRFVVPTAHRELKGNAFTERSGAGFNVAGCSVSDEAYHGKRANPFSGEEKVIKWIK